MNGARRLKIRILKMLWPMLLSAVFLACAGSARKEPMAVPPAVPAGKPAVSGKAADNVPAVEAQAAARPQEEKPGPASPDNVARDVSHASDAGKPSQTVAEGGPETPGITGSATATAPSDEPGWAREKEELVYRMEFLGITMGYARFNYKGRVSWNGRDTYHLSVRAWTSGLLSVFYPFDGTVEYFLDLKTLTPLRQEFSGKMKDADYVAVFDQARGKIVYRNKKTGVVRNEVDTPVNIYDPVTAAYYYRTRDPGTEETPRHVYAGRKIWQISMKTIGREKIDSSIGPVEAVVIQTVITREGRVENNAGMKMWISGDARHVPVRIHANFRKIKMWTMEAELMPPHERG